MNSADILYGSTILLLTINSNTVILSGTLLECTVFQRIFFEFFIYALSCCTFFIVSLNSWSTFYKVYRCPISQRTNSIFFHNLVNIKSAVCLLDKRGILFIYFLNHQTRSKKQTKEQGYVFQYIFCHRSIICAQSSNIFT